MIDLSVTVPVHNEIESLGMFCGKLYEVLPGLGRTYEVLLVDDGSTDGTWELMLELAGKYPNLRLIRFRRNFGQTAAMSAGFRESKGNIIITLDADLQNDPADIPVVLEKLDQGFDVVSGWRKDRHDPFVNRRLPSMLANKLISKMTGVHLHDYGCTLKAYRRDIMKDVHLYGEMHRFIPALAYWVGGRIAEVPVRHHARRYGTSKYGMSRTIRVVLDLITVKFLLNYSKGPIQMFGKIGLAFAVPGLLTLGWIVAAHLLYLWFGIDSFADVYIKRPFWILTPFMLILFGTQFVSIGLLGEILIRTYHEAQDKPIYFIKETVAGTRQG